MKTTIDSSGEKTTEANKTDMKQLRAVKAMARHAESNVPGLSQAGKMAAENLDIIIRHFDPPTVKGSTPAQ